MTAVFSEDFLDVPSRVLKENSAFVHTFLAFSILRQPLKMDRYTLPIILITIQYVQTWQAIYITRPWQSLLLLTISSLSCLALHQCPPLSQISYKNMRGGNGGNCHLLLQYNQKAFIKHDNDHKKFFGSFHGCYTNCIETNINDEEDQNSFGYDGHHETNGHAIEDDDCNDYQPFDHDERTLYWESQEALLQVCICISI